MAVLEKCVKSIHLEKDHMEERKSKDEGCGCGVKKLRINERRKKENCGEGSLMMVSNHSSEQEERCKSTASTTLDT